MRRPDAECVAFVWFLVSCLEKGVQVGGVWCARPAALTVKLMGRQPKIADVIVSADGLFLRRSFAA
jgi:hypothetical protein